MKLENQVCSLEISKRLKELGVKQESLFWWSDPVKKARDTSSESWQPRLLQSNRDKESEKCDIYSAFTVAELGEILSEHRICDQFGNGTKKWYTVDENGKTFEADTEADARGKMRIYLSENKLI